MKSYLITTGTITYAIKGRDVLRRNGFKAQVTRKSSGLNETGCGYAISLFGNINTAEALLRNSGVKILQINEN